MNPGVFCGLFNNNFASSFLVSELNLVTSNCTVNNDVFFKELRGGCGGNKKWKNLFAF